MSILYTRSNSAEEDLKEWAKWARIPGNSELFYKPMGIYQDSQNDREPIYITWDRAYVLDGIISRAGKRAENENHHEAMLWNIVGNASYEIIGKKLLKCGKSKAGEVVKERFNRVCGMIEEYDYYRDA